MKIHPFIFSILPGVNAIATVRVRPPLIPPRCRPWRRRGIRVTRLPPVAAHPLSPATSHRSSRRTMRVSSDSWNHCKPSASFRPKLPIQPKTNLGSSSSRSNNNNNDSHRSDTSIRSIRCLSFIPARKTYHRTFLTNEVYLNPSPDATVQKTIRPFAIA